MRIIARIKAVFKSKSKPKSTNYDALYRALDTNLAAGRLVVEV